MRDWLWCQVLQMQADQQRKLLVHSWIFWWSPPSRPSTLWRLRARWHRRRWWCGSASLGYRWLPRTGLPCLRSGADTQGAMWALPAGASHQGMHYFLGATPATHFAGRWPVDGFNLLGATLPQPFVTYSWTSNHLALDQFCLAIFAAQHNPVALHI